MKCQFPELNITQILKICPLNFTLLQKTKKLINSKKLLWFIQNNQYNIIITEKSVLRK